MEVDQAYSIARRLSNNFYHRHNMVPHLDQEDYVQECMVAWLRYKNMNFSCITTFRNHAPLSRKDARDGKPIPIYIQEVVLDYGSCLEAERNLNLFFIQKAMKKLPDRIYQILDMSYFQHMTLKKIGIEMGLSEARISQLRSEGIKKLKRIFNGNGSRTTISH